jgi:hypothetical protein
MKIPIAKFIVEPPVFPQTIHTLRPDPKPATKARTRENIFSKSRDTREDRGTREMKTSHNKQIMPNNF